METQVAQAALRTAGFDAIVAFDRMHLGGQFVSSLTLVGSGSTNTVDLVEARSERYAHGVIDRAIVGELRGQKMRVVSPEDFVSLKILATRERDLEDAASVIHAIGSALDISAIADELKLLASELTDHDVANRWRRLNPAVRRA